MRKANEERRRGLNVIAAGECRYDCIPGIRVRGQGSYQPASDGQPLRRCHEVDPHARLVVQLPARVAKEAEELAHLTHRRKGKADLAGRESSEVAWLRILYL